MTGDAIPPGIDAGGGCSGDRKLAIIIGATILIGGADRNMDHHGVGGTSEVKTAGAAEIALSRRKNLVAVLPRQYPPVAAFFVIEGARGHVARTRYQPLVAVGMAMRGEIDAAGIEIDAIGLHIVEDAIAAGTVAHAGPAAEPAVPMAVDLRGPELTEDGISHLVPLLP